MIKINLIKPQPKDLPGLHANVSDSEDRAKRKNPPPIYSLVIFGLIVICGILFIQQKNGLKREISLLNDIKAEKNKLKNVLTVMEQLEIQKTIFERKIALINDLKGQQQTPVIILEELSNGIPDWVWLTEATYEKKYILIKGKALSNNLIADYIYKLEESPYFDKVNFISSTQKKNRGTDYFEFSLTAKFSLPSPPEASLGEMAKKEDR
jgi:Tfp pilus assembly protein PilN